MNNDVVGVLMNHDGMPLITMLNFELHYDEAV